MADPSEYRPAPGSIPTEPGVYRFRDPEGRVVYVGKAKNLRARLNSYFQDFASLHSRTQSMLTAASSVDWVTVATEVEALVLEYSWIKQYAPRYNVRFRDDKSYPYLAITVADQYPKVSVVREAKRKGTRYFGPYAHAWAVRSTLDELTKVFPIRTCREGVFKQAKRSQRACLLGYIDKCSAPCVGGISEDEYRDLVNDLIRFLSGHSGEFLRRIQQRMESASAELDFESAAKWRDKYLAIERVMEKNSVVFDDGTDADVIAVSFTDLDIGVQIFHVRSGRISGERFIAVERIEDIAQADYVERIVTKTYSDLEPGGIPREILISEKATNADTLEQWLTQLRGTQVRVRVPHRGDKRALMHTAMDNARQSLERSVLERGSDLTIRTQALNDLQQALDLTEPPLRIECIDISTLQGTHTVASLVVYEDALPKKSEYRTFIIKGDKVDDLSSIHEVVSRRFRASNDKRIEEDVESKKFAYRPSLLVIDGAKGQVDAAMRALHEHSIDIPVIGLAKRLEEVWIAGSTDPVIFSRNSPALHLLQRIRDEAHRVAIGLHRKRRGDSAISSELDSIPGLGPARRRALLAHFGSVSQIKRADVKQIANVPGIGPTLAQIVVETLHSEVLDPSANV